MKITNHFIRKESTMEQKYSNTNPQKGKTLTLSERRIIQNLFNKHCSITEIAVLLGRAYNTIKNELERGKTLKYNGKIQGYDADTGNDASLYNRAKCRRRHKILEKKDFLNYVYLHINQGWSCDACVGEALSSGAFNKKDIVCTKTLYNAISSGIIAIKSADLPEKMGRKKNKKHHHRHNKRLFGRSIEERPKEVATREEFGHWEADLVIGARGSKKVLLTLLERKTRWYVTIPVASKETKAVVSAIKAYISSFGNRADDIFKSITTDNGSEFSSLPEIEKNGKTLIYFAHPYSAYEKGSNERHNKLLRRYIPKGLKIDDFSDGYINKVTMLCNRLPRKILGYRTPEKLFHQEIQKLKI